MDDFGKSPNLEVGKAVSANSLIIKGECSKMGFLVSVGHIAASKT